MSARALAATAAALAMGIARPARAVGDAPIRAEDRVAASVAPTGVAAPGADTWQLAPRLALAVRASRAVVIHADGAVAFTSYRFGEAPRGAVTRASNVLVGARASLLDDARLRLDVGGAAGAPLVTVPSGGITASAAAEHADRTAMAGAGPRDAWLWTRSTIPVFATARMEATFHRARFVVDVQPGVLVSVNRDPSYAALVAAFDASYGIGRVRPALGAASFVATRALGGRDFAQSAVYAALRYDPLDERVFAWAEGRLLLDGPDGVLADGATPWSVTLGAGARF